MSKRTPDGRRTLPFGRRLYRRIHSRAWFSPHKQQRLRFDCQGNKKNYSTGPEEPLFVVVVIINDDLQALRRGNATDDLDAFYLRLLSSGGMPDFYPEGSRLTMNRET